MQMARTPTPPRPARFDAAPRSKIKAAPAISRWADSAEPASRATSHRDAAGPPDQGAGSRLVAVDAPDRHGEARNFSPANCSIATWKPAPARPDSALQDKIHPDSGAFAPPGAVARRMQFILTGTARSARRRKTRQGGFPSPTRNKMR
jgi:hypothetical protein